MMKKYLLAIMILFCFCSLRREYLGEVTDFEILPTGFIQNTKVIIHTTMGKKFSTELYKDIAVRDSVFKGDAGIIWISPRN